MRGTKRRSRLPTFLVIGAAKSATTSVHEYLAQHPDVFMSRVKEPNYFSFVERPPDFRGPDDDGISCEATPDRLRVAKYGYSICDPAAYERLFDGANGQRAIGESSVSYLYFPEAPAQIEAALPDVRLVAILRHPVDRAFSKYAQFRRDGCEPLEDFEAALDAEETRVARNWSPTWFYKRRGDYVAQLSRFYQRFDPARIRVHLYDDLVDDPHAVLRDIFRFLGVDEGFVPDLGRRYNPSGAPRRTPRHRALDRLAGSPAVTRLPGRSADLAQRILVRANSVFTPWTPPAFAPELRARLIEEHRTEIEKLSDLIDRDLTHWLRP